MITCYTAMSKNIGPDSLASALGSLSEALDAAADAAQTDAVVLARVVRGFSSESWTRLSETSLAQEWHAFPVKPEAANICISGAGDGVFPVSPFSEVYGALNSSMFQRQINSELLRLSRNGGCLSIIGSGIAERKRIKTALGEMTFARLNAMLGDILLSMLESCDCLGILKDNLFGCCLPGIGQLGARNFAEKAQAAFEEAARPFFPTGGITAGQGATCAFGIVNLMQGEKGTGAELMQRAKTTLEIAMGKDEGHIHQESTFTPLDGATLVQSSEKRFLFFGGDQS